MKHKHKWIKLESGWEDCKCGEERPPKELRGKNFTGFKPVGTIK